MGEKSSILVGLTIANLNREPGLRPVSSAERKWRFPVSLRSLFVLRSRIA